MVNVNKLCPGCMNEMDGSGICSICGYDSLSKNDVDCLNVRYILSGRYVIGKVLDRSSEGITYLAFDQNKNIPVNIREYFPLSISSRNPDKTVSIQKSDTYSFNEGLIEFLELNRKLSAIESDCLFPVNAIFEDNSTAYAVFSQNTGITLSNFLDVNGGVLKWEQARPLFLPLIDTIIKLNENGIIHGGISPESIFVSRDGKLRLSNISIIQTRFASENFQTAIYPGCAAIEQYSTEKGNMGSFTDVYGLAATIFRVLIGNLPDPANERIHNDSMAIPSHFADELPRQVLVSLANALQVKIAGRTQTVEKFRDELVYGETEENIIRAETRRKNEEIMRSKRIAEKMEPNGKSKHKNSSLKYGITAALCTVGAFVIIGVIMAFTVLKGYFFPKKPVEKTSDADSMPSVASIGEIDEGADVIEEKKYEVPNLIGKYYTELKDIEKIDVFNISIADKKFSNSVPRGAICSQSVKAGNSVVRNTKIKVSISLGPSTIKIADVTGLTTDKAIIELLKQGFLYDNISLVEKFDADNKAGTVISQTPQFGQSVNTEIKIVLYYAVNNNDDTDSEDLIGGADNIE
ncbi:MAG: PASTA domain-containing protein [Clostridia bacterium]|nr:PASTA domain-containing protein [Clostridia bacterium]